MTPYYEREGVRLFLGDCLEVISSWEDGSVEFIVTDPPWKAQAKGVVRRTHLGVARSVSDQRSISYGDIGTFCAQRLQQAFRVCKHDMLVLCGYKELGEVIDVLSPIRGVFVWHKPNGGISVAYPAPLDAAYIVWGAHVSKITGFQHWRSCVFSHAVPTAGCISNGERILVEPNGKAAHPCQGPKSLYLDMTKPMVNGTVLDPWMGTGTSGVAAIERHLNYVGIEINEKYLEIAAKRLDRILSEPRLPFVEERPEVQAELFSE